MTIPTITLGLRLRLARETAGIGVADMAAKLGITRQTIARYEHDQVPVPVPVIWAYHGITEQPLEWFEGRADLTQEVAAIRCMSQLPLWVDPTVRAA
jgi:transcriptional regulator with XRE-family HTH domain